MPRLPTTEFTAGLIPVPDTGWKKIPARTGLEEEDSTNRVSDGPSHIDLDCFGSQERTVQQVSLLGLFASYNNTRIVMLCSYSF